MADLSSQVHVEQQYGRFMVVVLYSGMSMQYHHMNIYLWMTFSLTP